MTLLKTEIVLDTCEHFWHVSCVLCCMHCIHRLWQFGTARWHCTDVWHFDVVASFTTLSTV